jgi:hypothetical protein
MNKLSPSLLFIIAAAFAIDSSLAFTASHHGVVASISKSTSSLNGLFDKWGAGGSGKDRLDDEWQKQQEILKFRRSSTENKQKYFEDVRMLCPNR